MWTIIIFAVIAVFLGVRNFVLDDFYGDIEDWFMGGVITVLSALVGGLFGLLVALALPADMEVQETPYELVTLQDNGGVEGNFFLGCGTINSKMMYVFYYKDGVTEEGDIIYKMGQVKYDNADVVYKSKTPYILQYKEVETGAFINNFAIDCTNTWYRIFVPKGTINNSYSLDAQ